MPAQPQPIYTEHGLQKVKLTITDEPSDKTLSQSWPLAENDGLLPDASDFGWMLEELRKRLGGPGDSFRISLVGPEGAPDFSAMGPLSGAPAQIAESMVYVLDRLCQMYVADITGEESGEQGDAYEEGLHALTIDATNFAIQLMNSGQEFSLAGLSVRPDKVVDHFVYAKNDEDMFQQAASQLLQGDTIMFSLIGTGRLMSRSREPVDVFVAYIQSPTMEKTLKIYRPYIKTDQGPVLSGDQWEVLQAMPWSWLRPQ